MIVALAGVMLQVAGLAGIVPPGVSNDVVWLGGMILTCTGALMVEIERLRRG